MKNHLVINQTIIIILAIIGVLLFVYLTYFIMPELWSNFPLRIADQAVGHKYHNDWEMLYYLLAGVGGIATVILIFVTIYQVQKQIKKDLFLRSADFIIDELYVHIIDIAYHWEHGAWINYALDKHHVGKVIGTKFGPVKSMSIGKVDSVTLPAHQNRITLALQLLVNIDKLHYSIDKKNRDILESLQEYVGKFETLIKNANGSAPDLVQTYENSFLGKLAQAMKRIIKENHV